MPKRRIIPVFIPHLGCPHACLFCNQHTVAGREAPPTVAAVDAILRKSVEKAGGEPQVAFYGGSFTCLPGEEMESYLRVAAKWVTSIRLSTRPDGVSPEVLSVLKNYPVTEIELGGQSSDNRVLWALRRGHTFDHTQKASCLIKEQGFSLGLQMMTGLPGSSREKEIKTAKDFLELSPDFVRIYPTLVLPNTELEQMYIRGEYTPQTLADAVEEVADLWQLFEQKDVQVIRMGLNESETLRSQVTAGPYHPAFGELVISRCLRKSADKLLSQARPDCGSTVALFVENGRESQMAGQKRENILYLQKKYSLGQLLINPKTAPYDHSFNVSLNHTMR